MLHTAKARQSWAAARSTVSPSRPTWLNACERHERDPALARPLGRDPGSEPGGNLAEAPGAVDVQFPVPLADGRNGTRQDAPRVDVGGILHDPNETVRVDSLQIGEHERLGDDPGRLRGRAGSLEHLADRPVERFRPDGRHQDER